ncbi:hypothetical protein [Hymenobacter cheonanensis]|uniref:hypothetical protein n=1 Tax=Hymenobacter sp. CA2-7 TaxID=3063993 RepID=UPI002713F01C|nr:hypothetical protein [Hymenobacter sp. CA2-7]MDO7888155.1 hypothetical protein [Hymenobacter sp. CA2-7]
MPATLDTATLTVYPTGLANLNDAARRLLLGKAAVLLSAPTSPGSRWLLLPVAETGEGALTLYDDRGQRRLRAFTLATALFAALPAGQKRLRLALQLAPVGYWLAPLAEVQHKSAPAAQAA